MPLWGKDDVRRFDDTLQETAHSGVPELVQLAQCIDRIMQASSAGARLAAKGFLGGHLSLGYHRQDSAAIQRHRHNVRGALLAQILLSPPQGHTATRAQMLAMNAAALRQQVQNVFTHAQKPHPVINGTGLCQVNFNMAGRGGLRHELPYASSTGNMAHLCYMPTREMAFPPPRSPPPYRYLTAATPTAAPARGLATVPPSPLAPRPPPPRTRPKVRVPATSRHMIKG